MLRIVSLLQLSECDGGITARSALCSGRSRHRSNARAVLCVSTLVMNQTMLLRGGGATGVHHGVRERMGTVRRAVGRRILLLQLQLLLLLRFILPHPLLLLHLLLLLLLLCLLRCQQRCGSRPFFDFFRRGSPRDFALARSTDTTTFA